MQHRFSTFIVLAVGKRKSDSVDSRKSFHNDDTTLATIIADRNSIAITLETTLAQFCRRNGGSDGAQERVSIKLSSLSLITYGSGHACAFNDTGFTRINFLWRVD